MNRERNPFSWTNLSLAIFVNTILAYYNIVYVSNMFIIRIYFGVSFSLLFGELIDSIIRKNFMSAFTS